MSDQLPAFLTDPAKSRRSIPAKPAKKATAKKPAKKAAPKTKKAVAKKAPAKKAAAKKTAAKTPTKKVAKRAKPEPQPTPQPERIEPKPEPQPTPFSMFSEKATRIAAQPQPQPNGHKPLSLKEPPKLKPHQTFTHPENYSRTVGDMAKGAYCHHLDVTLDCISHAEAQLRKMKEGILAVREEKWQRAPADWELEILHEMKRLMHCAAVLQFLHNLGINTGPKPSESRHMRKFKSQYQNAQ